MNKQPILKFSPTGLYGPGIVDFLYDAMELGDRVALALDSENNTPDVHFCGWYPFPPYEHNGVRVE